MPSLKCKVSSSTRDMSPAKKIQLMVHPEENTTTAPSSFLPSPSLCRSDNTYATSMHLAHQLSRSLYSKEKPPFPSPELIACHSSRNGQPSTLLLKSTPEPSLHKHSTGSMVSRFPCTVQHTPKPAKPAPYAKDLCPLPSTRHPHVLASERLQGWMPLHGCKSVTRSPANLAPDDI